MLRLLRRHTAKVILHLFDNFVYETVLWYGIFHGRCNAGARWRLLIRDAQPGFHGHGIRIKRLRELLQGRLVPATDGQGWKTGGKMRSRGLIFFSPLFEAVVTQVGLKLEVHLP